MTDVTATPDAEAAPATAVPVTPAPAAAPAASIIPAPEAAAPVKPEGLPDEFWDADANAVKPEAWTKFAELQAQAAERAVPETYELATDEPVLDHAGQPVTFDADDPLAQGFLAVAKEQGLSQTAVSAILKTFAAAEVDAAKQASEAIAGEIVKLGPEHGKRTAAVHSFVAAAAGAEKAEALRLSIGSAAAFEALEAIIAKAQGPTVTAAPPTTPNADLDGLYGAERLAAIRARQAG